MLVWQLCLEVNWEWGRKGGIVMWIGTNSASIVLVASLESLQHCCPELLCHFLRYYQNACRALSHMKKCLTKEQNPFYPFLLPESTAAVCCYSYWKLKVQY